MGTDVVIAILKEQLDIAKEYNAQLVASNGELRATINELNRTIKEQNTIILDQSKSIDELKELLKCHDADLEKTKSEIRVLESVFMPKQSEKRKAKPCPDVQRSAEELAAEAETEKQRKAEERKARGNNGAKRKEYPDLKTVESDVYPDDRDQYPYACIGVHDIISYEMIPMSFVKRIDHIMVLKNLKDGTIHCAKGTAKPLLNSNYSASFIAGLAELRYVYAMPVERIVKYFTSHGFEVNKQTAHDLLARVSEVLDKLQAAAQSAVKEDTLLNCDETYFRILIQDHKEGEKGTRKGYFWVIVAPNLGITYFFYDDGSRSKDVIINELKGYKGRIQSDGLSAYKTVALLSNGDIRRASCLQHCKRPFFDKNLKDNPDANRILDLSNSLYHYEHMHVIGKDGWTIEDNLKWRQEYAPPILKELKSELTRIRDDTDNYPPKSLMHKASNYFLNEWDGIEFIASSGDIPWDNSIVERVNRFISLSRKNSLFHGSHAGAVRGCFYYSLAGSCYLNDVSFFDYFSDVLNRTATLPPDTPVEVYRELLPDRWKKSKGMSECGQSEDNK